MTREATAENTARVVTRRADEIFAETTDRHHRGTDTLFARLMMFQWAFAVVLALLLTPFSWVGGVRTVHVHVYTALVLGGAISALPIYLAARRPGETSTRMVIASAQMLWSALLIHITGGRIETHFHVFGSLAFLAFYRDWRVLVPATVMVAGDHLIRGLLVPQSVYGIANPEWWRFLEHAAWLVFEDVVLVISCLRATAEMHEMATNRATLELLSESERRKSAALDAALVELSESQEAQLRAERLAAVGELAAGVGHDLRNPLAAIQNAQAYIATRLANDASVEPRVRKFLGIIEREVNVCARIISDLLDFARQRVPTRGPCLLRDLVDEAVSVVSNERVNVLNDVPSTLPVLDLDRDQFRQVLVNLVQNAVEAVHPEKRGSVVVRARGGDGYPFEISVADDGGGIPDDVARRIFEPLFTTKSKGTGLGLAIVSKIVRSHSGTIRVESERDVGSRFVIELPHDAALVAGEGA